MIGAIHELTDPPRNLRGRMNMFIVLFFLALVPIISHAGGLGMAPLVTIIGLSGWLTVTRPHDIRPNFAVFAFCAFISWAVLSSLWSPYQSGDVFSNPVKLFIGMILFVGSFKAVRAAGAYAPKIFLHLFIAANFFMCGLIIIDQLSNFGLTFFFDPINEGEPLYRKRADSIMNVGHGVTVASIFLGPVIALIMKFFKNGLILSLLYIALYICAAYLSGLAAGILSGLVSLAIIFTAYKWPRLTLTIVIYLAIFSLLLAPLLGWVCAQLPESFIEQLPLSWKHRVIMWDYTTNRIWEAAIWGHGFDAVRTFDDTITIGGVDNWPIVSLHPHNAGLHIWVETGVIGVFFAVLTLILTRHYVLPLVERSKYFSVALSSFIMGALIISALSYGVWQEWWWASLIFAAALVNWVRYVHKN